ncbi:hypothetical protein KP509_07G080900 [Ceratopteris richardii]|uniref:Late embryogenesis abundant protein LEA-2 subgroup domain-containing protein n=1 Tax=Ceratopteris richardii TaxID=49495 RepID=A0A8T2UN11_CERRI|nr:hypothetical protein KP509_07G080900 [Ceratopteris richardii]
MGDHRVYPYGDGHDRIPVLYPSVNPVHDGQEGLLAASSSKFSAANGAHVNKKEQTQALIQAREVSDSDSLNVAESQDQEQLRRRRRGCRWCRRCCCCVFGFVLTLVILIGVLVGVFFLVFHPKLPKYTVTNATLRRFELNNATSNSNGSPQGTVFLTAELDLTVQMKNPNKKIGIDYRSIHAAFFYDSLDIGEGSIPGFYQGHKNTTDVNLVMMGRDIPLTPTFASELSRTLANDDSLTLHTRAIVRLRIKLGRWKLHTWKVRIKCGLQISNPTRGNVRLLHNSCKFKLLRFRL